MGDWTPGQITALCAVVASAAFGFAALGFRYLAESRRRMLANLTPEDRSTRDLGELIARAAGELDNETVDEVLAIFARSSLVQKRAIVAAIAGMFDSASDGVHNLPDLSTRVLSISRNFGHPATAHTPAGVASVTAG